MTCFFEYVPNCDVDGSQKSLRLTSFPGHSHRQYLHNASDQILVVGTRLQNLSHGLTLVSRDQTLPTWKALRSGIYVPSHGIRDNIFDYTTFALSNCTVFTSHASHLLFHTRLSCLMITGSIVNSSSFSLRASHRAWRHSYLGGCMCVCVCVCTMVKKDEQFNSSHRPFPAPFS